MSQRIAYIDYAKALAIILVVTGHVIFFSIYNQDSQKSDTLLIETILKNVQMPLFIFCSGLVMKRSFDNIKVILQDLIKRFRQLIVPFLVVGVLYALLNDRTPVEFLSKGMKLGYWYLLTLFELYILHYVYCLVSLSWRDWKGSILYDTALGG